MLESNVYVQVSHIENSPNSICEAMLLGLPIIASNAGGTSSLLKDKESGILLQDGDSFSFAGAIIEVSENRELANSMGLRAYEISHKRHDPKGIVSELYKKYREIISDSSDL